MFNPFKKKDVETLDLTPGGNKKSSDDIPIPSEMKVRLQAQAKDIAGSQESVQATTTEPSPDSNSGGFFGGFFGGEGAAGATPSSTPTSSVSSYSGNSGSEIEKRIDRLNMKTTKMEQRIELLERKLDVRSG